MTGHEGNGTSATPTSSPGGRGRQETAGTIVSWQRGDLAALGLIGAYLLVFAATRLAVSPAMELDEAEQFLAGRSLSWGYAGQAPLYSWIVHGVSRLFGLNIEVLVGVKYVLIFFFFASFFRVARRFHAPPRAFLVSASLLLFPLYSYEFNRDLSHTVLVTCVSAATLLVFCRLYEHRLSRDFVLFGACLVTGMLSKYNFVFFAAALLLATLTQRSEGGIMRDPRFAAAVLASGAVIAMLVVLHAGLDLSPLTYALDKSRPRDPGSTGLAAIITTSLSAFSGLFLFLLLTLPFFRTAFLPGAGRTIPEGAGAVQRLSQLLRRAAVFGILLPVLFVVIAQPGRFSTRWVAPVLLLVPLALFSSSWSRVSAKRVRLFALLCAAVAVAVLLVRIATGFFPDLVGKVERIHIPFPLVADRLRREMKDHGVSDLAHVTIVTAGSHLAANLLVQMPDARIVTDEEMARNAASHDGIYAILWDATRLGPEIPSSLASSFTAPQRVSMVEIPYLRTRTLPGYRLGLAFPAARR